jgi:ABC-2 type transport system permease protein
MSVALSNRTTKMESASSRHYWNLIRELAAADFKLKYQGSVFGYLWSLMKPLAIFGVLYLVFTVFVRIGSKIPHYPLYLLMGIVLWNYFSEATFNGMRCIVDKSDLIRKVYFPRIIILFSSSVSAFITLLLNLVIIFVFMVILRVVPTASAPLFALLIFELYLLALGLSFFLGAFYVKYRDFAYIWEVLLQLLFYASAIIYPLSIIPEKYQKFLALSPITQIIQDSRKVLISNQTLSVGDILHGPARFIPYLIPLILVILGFIYFQRAASRFAEDV